jgi:hypothetical protein
MTTDIFGQGVQRNIRAVFDWPLKHRTEQRVIAHDDRRMPLSLADSCGDTADQRDIHQAVSRIRRGFDKDHRHPALAHGILRCRADRGFVDAIGKADRADGQTCKRLGE